MAGKFPTVPIGVGADRVASAKMIAQAAAVDLFILDDGFQHWSVLRQFDVVCVDVSRP
ncbi:tetraacyldisaccharide 4'-kinase [Neisseria sp. P0017.S004]|uniref:tetraacyldisaccharide 4'-kinase n=1 Tax=Neisseria sp. P0017.S004 TaxID=3436780 RepID=UPI003F818B85